MPQTYELAGGDGGAYGAEFGPVLADEVVEFESEGSRYLMLRLQTPIHYKSQPIEYFVVSPRYAEGTLKKLRRTRCTVGVGRVLPGQEETVIKTGISSATVDYWAIGICRPKRQTPNT